MESVTVRVSFSVQVDLEVWQRVHELESSTLQLRRDVKERLREHVEQLDEVTNVRLVNGPHR